MGTAAGGGGGGGGGEGGGGRGGRRQWERERAVKLCVNVCLEVRSNRERVNVRSCELKILSLGC